MSFTAALAAQLLGLGRRLRIALWVWLAVTAVGTIYLGWHYVVDDIAGVLMGAAALVARARGSPGSASAPRAGGGATSPLGASAGPATRGVPGRRYRLGASSAQAGEVRVGE